MCWTNADQPFSDDTMVERWEIWSLDFFAGSVARIKITSSLNWGPEFMILFRKVPTGRRGLSFLFKYYSKTSCYAPEQKAGG